MDGLEGRDTGLPSCSDDRCELIGDCCPPIGVLAHVLRLSSDGCCCAGVTRCASLLPSAAAAAAALPGSAGCWCMGDCMSLLLPTHPMAPCSNAPGGRPAISAAALCPWGVPVLEGPAELQANID